MMSASIGDKKPNTKDRKTIIMMIMEKVRKKKQYHLPSRPPTLAQVDLAVVDQMDLEMVMAPRSRHRIVVDQKGATLRDRLQMHQQTKALQTSRMSRFREGKLVPPFPKVTHLDSWMSYCIANVLGACADPNHEEWIAWLNPAFRPNPDIDGLNDSGHIKFKSIDIKLGIAMSAMLKAAGDNALDLCLNVNRKSSKYVR